VVTQQLLTFLIRSHSKSLLHTFQIRQITQKVEINKPFELDKPEQLSTRDAKHIGHVFTNKLVLGRLV